MFKGVYFMYTLSVTLRHCASN